MIEINESYEFREWQKAFDRYFELRKDGIEKLRMVISTHWATSGYWVENNTTPVSSEDIEYVGEEVDKLYTRVKEELNQAQIEGRMPCFTT